MTLRVMPGGPRRIDMAENADAPVLVVGAGPVGLVAACELVRQGGRVR